MISYRFLLHYGTSIVSQRTRNRNFQNSPKYLNCGKVDSDLIASFNENKREQYSNDKKKKKSYIYTNTNRAQSLPNTAVHGIANSQ